MDAAKYEGEYTGNFMHSIKAHGKGKVTYENGKSFSGRFVNSKLQETGEIEIQYPDKSAYKGTWRDKVFEGQGIKTFPSGASLESEFEGTNSVGKAKVTFKKLNHLHSGKAFMNLNKYEEFKVHADPYYSDTHMQEEISGEVLQDKIAPNQFNFSEGCLTITHKKWAWNDDDLKKFEAINNKLLISFEFMTKETNCALYSMNDSDLDLRYSDKHIVIKNGHLATKFYGQSELTIHDS